MRRPATATWTHFSEFFESVARSGIDDLDAADALLSALQNGVGAMGFRRQFTIGDDGLVERLPRDLHAMPVPPSIWNECGEPQSNLTSQWEDDPEEAESWIRVDWVSGFVETLCWELSNFEHLRTDFGALQIPTKDAEKILGELSGNPKKMPGRPPGPSTDFERRQVLRALEMIAAGDTRSAPAIANELTDEALTGRALETQKGRLTYGIREAKSRNAKNSPKNK